MSAFIDAGSFTIANDVGTLPGGRQARFVGVLINGDDVLNEAALIDPSASASVLNLGGYQAIRVCRLGSTILWSPCIDDSFVMRRLSWTTMAFERETYEHRFGGSTDGLRPLDERESTYLAKLILPYEQFPHQAACEYCVPAAFDDPSGQSFVARLRRALFDEAATFLVCEPPDVIGQVLIGHAAGELVLEWGVSDGRRCLRFAEPVEAPVWIHNAGIDEALSGLQSE